MGQDGRSGARPTSSTLSKAPVQHDSIDEPFCLQYDTSDKLVVVSELSWRLTLRSHERTAVWLCSSACALTQHLYPGVVCPVCACKEARWSGSASLVDVPTSCIGLCAVKP